MENWSDKAIAVSLYVEDQVMAYGAKFRELVMRLEYKLNKLKA